jgi:4-hydroxy-tetrahydrodipicolinate synthase
MKLHGVIVPVATPLAVNDQLDEEAFRRLLNFLIDTGVHGVFINGSMGGFASLPDKVHRRAVDVAVEEVRGRLPVLAGISDTGTARVVEKLELNNAEGVDYYVVLPPYFYPLGQAELVRFFLEVAEASPKPVVIYENPKLVKNSLAPETIRRLAEHGNIHGIKLSSGDVVLWETLLHAPIDRNRFSFICGYGKLTHLGLQLGFDGITEGLHNLVPNLAVSLFESVANGDLAEAACLQQRINRCFGVFEVDGPWRGLEVSLQYMGIAERAAPHPFDLPIDPAKRERILSILHDEAVLQPLPSLRK